MSCLQQPFSTVHASEIVNWAYVVIKQNKPRVRVNNQILPLPSSVRMGPSTGTHLNAVPVLLWTTGPFKTT